MRQRAKRSFRFVGAGAVVAAISLSGCSLQEQPAVSDQVASYYSSAPTSTPSAPPAFKAIPAGGSVLIVGDSFTEGYGAEVKKEQGYAYLLAKSAGWNATIDGVGGTGFAWGGGADGTAGKTYLARLKARATTGIKPEMIVLQGGSNDYRAETGEMVAAVHDTVTFAKQTWPNAQVLVIAPMPVQPHGNNLRRVAAAELSGAAGAGAFFIDPNGLGWITVENTPQYAFTDGAHTNTAGHAYLASKIKETLDAYATAG